jgi:hypothetical protein
MKKLKRSNSGNACYHSVKNFLFSLLSENLKIRLEKTRILPVVLHGHETWSLTLRKEYRLRLFENRALRIFRPKKDEVMARWRNCIICTLCQV